MLLLPLNSPLSSTFAMRDECANLQVPKEAVKTDDANPHNRERDQCCWDNKAIGLEKKENVGDNSYTVQYVKGGHAKCTCNGCLSRCLDKEPSRDMVNTCSDAGSGCCQVDVPENLGYFAADFNNNYNTTERWNYSRCSYVAVMEKAAFVYNGSYISTRAAFFDAYEGKVPAVMDWLISERTCQEAKTTYASFYACVSSNSECVDSTNGRSGHRRNCSHGYHGNPYIKDGCTDIDECLDNATYPCLGICSNTPGNFTCSCPRTNRLIGGICVPNHKPLWVMPVVGASVGLVLLVVVISCAYLTKERRKLQGIKHEYFRQHGGLLLFEEIIKSQQSGVAFRIFSEEELQQATNRFDEQRVLGQGSHGTVYKGVLKDDAEVAVKRCTTIDEQHKKEFGKEMLILSQINHRNIVKLLGCCLEVEVPILVYESQFVTLVQGTCGYLDPEYMQTCHLTDKSDVYSFGVVLLELITGRKAFNLQGLDHEKSLSMRFLSAMKENKLEDMLDDQIRNDEDMEFLEEVAELAVHCLEMCGVNRPSMKDVADRLERLRKVMRHPWAQQSPQETESLLGESTPTMLSSVLVSTESFSIEKKAVKALEPGR